MFTNYIENYKKFSEKMRFISKLGAFIFTIFSFLSLLDLVLFYSNYPKYWEDALSENSNFLLAIIFQVTILLVFFTRFIMLFFKTEKSFQVNQILWLVGLALLGSYWFVSRPTDTGFSLYATYTSVFLAASRSFDILGTGYLLLSLPIKLLILVGAVIKSK